MREGDGSRRGLELAARVIDYARHRVGVAAVAERIAIHYGFSRGWIVGQVGDDGPQNLLYIVATCQGQADADCRDQQGKAFHGLRGLWFDYKFT